jgi:choline-sulfatase
MAQPNIVLILGDNQSPWTLGCYGNDEIRTPNIDRLASGGIRFTSMFCNNPVCSPNRATCLTGLMPSQHGVHSWLGTEKPDAQTGPDAYCTIEEFQNLPAMLAEEGYTTGMTGKWHLGDSVHFQLGFKYWYAMTYGHTPSFYNMEVAWKGKIHKEPRYTSEVFAEHAVNFIRDNAAGPFFLHVGFNGPYCVDGDLLSGHRNRHTEYYAGKELKCFPRTDPHPWQRTFIEAFHNPVARRSYAAAVSGVDDGVGAILDELDRLGIADNTIVVYAADHGACAGHHGMWGMGEHAAPYNMTDTTLRVPLLIRHPGHMPEGKTFDGMTSHCDFLPSSAEYLGLQGKLRNEPELSGRSYCAVLRDEPVDPGRQIVFSEYEHARVVRTPEWKLVRRKPDGPDQLFNMVNDADETTNLIDDAGHENARTELDNELTAFFGRYCDKQYDMWGAGRSKAGDSHLGVLG